MKRTWLGTVPAYLAGGGAAMYLLFAVFAYLRYPGDFSPVNNNWLSDLGNRNLNPDGADFYVAGCILAGTFLCAFFVSLALWRATGSKVQNWLLLGVQVAGLIAAVSLVMSAVYTEDKFTTHQFWSRFIWGGFAVATFMAPFALRRRGRSSASLIAIGAAGYTSIVAQFVFDSAHWLEWPSLALILLFVCWVGWMSASRDRGLSVETLELRPGALKPEI